MGSSAEGSRPQVFPCPSSLPCHQDVLPVIDDTWGAAPQSDRGHPHADAHDASAGPDRGGTARRLQRMPRHVHRLLQPGHDSCHGVRVNPFLLYHQIDSPNPRWALLCLVWSGKGDSNPRPSAWEADALPTELFQLARQRYVYCCAHYRKERRLAQAMSGVSDFNTNADRINERDPGVDTLVRDPPRVQMLAESLHGTAGNCPRVAH
jgi:hypothetical protein